jgi:archaemetzincin
MTRRSLTLGILWGLCIVFLLVWWFAVPRRALVGGPVPVLGEEEVEELLDSPAGRSLSAAIENLRPLHTELGPPGADDWLACYHEPGQTFEEYLAIDPVAPKGIRHKLYIQPLGEFTDTQREIVTLTAEFMALYFSLPVEVLEDLPDSLVPENRRRIGPLGVEQLRTGYIRDEILVPRLPEDAAAFIAFTACDLWPGPGWNFVFGEASYGDRVAVWSICRFGEPEKSEEEFRRVLLHAMKTGTHETGHMFTMFHCTAYECNMCGSNSLPEAARHPLWLCPECMAKICWATGADPVARFRKLSDFCKQHGFAGEHEFYEKSIEALTENE